MQLETDNLLLRKPTIEDLHHFLSAVLHSQNLHHPWVYPPDNVIMFSKYLSNLTIESNVGFLLIEKATQKIVGVINISGIARGVFQSAYLGFYAFHPFQGKGLMRSALAKVIEYAFKEEGLHRLEANIQPQNQPSQNLVKSLEFKKEGYSERFLKINGVWRDHERWAILAD